MSTLIFKISNVWIQIYCLNSRHSVDLSYLYLCSSCTVKNVDTCYQSYHQNWPGYYIGHSLVKFVNVLQVGNKNVLLDVFQPADA